MKSLFWVLLNLIGFIILSYMYYNNSRKQAEKDRGQMLFNWLLLSVMVFLASDTAFFFIDAAVFPGARTLNYAVNIINHIVLPLPGLLFLLYCDSEVVDKRSGENTRTVFFFLPCLLYAVAAITTPLTHMLFEIDEFNTYARGSHFIILSVIVYGYPFLIYPTLSVRTKNKRAVRPKDINIYLYLYPVPAIIMGILQAFYYGSLILGFGFVMSVFLLYLYRVQVSEEKHSLSIKFQNLSIIQFAAFSAIMVAGMFLYLESTTNEISKDYALHSSRGAAGLLENYLSTEIGVLDTASRSKAVLDWFEDEMNEEKKHLAYDAFLNVTGVLHSRNIYAVVGESGQEYWVERDSGYDGFNVRGTVSRNDPKDNWVFDLMDMRQKYNLNVDYAKGTEITETWLNIKAINAAGETTGLLSTRMELSGIAAQALSTHFDADKSRTLIIDENGVVIMDSKLAGTDNLLIYDARQMIDEQFANPQMLSVIYEHLSGMDGYFPEMYNESVVTQLNTGTYRYMTITPIGMTSWSVVTLYDSTSLFGIINMLPLILIILAMFIIFSYSSNRLMSRMIFAPLKRLIGSIIDMQVSGEQSIYGMSRNDEIGLLANTIQDYFTKGYYDELTGIYNRRYLEITLRQIVTTLSRSEHKLSIMMIDIDNFKLYNDTYGHGQGDLCLKAIAGALSGAIMRKSDFIARYGGEEFAAVLPYADEEGARTLAEGMLAVVRDMKLPHKHSKNGIVTVSIGVTTVGSATVSTYEEYLKKADEALYMSKRDGKDRHTFLAIGD